MRVLPAEWLSCYEVIIMKWIKFALLLSVLCGTAASAPAWAQRHHGGGHARSHVGVFIGAPLFWPYYPQPYYYPPYYPSVVVAPSAPPVYIEQEPLSPQQYWYFCSNPQGYYPYVKQCPPGWQQVMPQAPGK